jgi:ribosomal 50S subunit-associated protein YjgA (DUF615 family)
MDRLDVSIFKTVWYWVAGVRKKDLKDLEDLNQRINDLKKSALARGMDEAKRSASRETLYLDE